MVSMLNKQALRVGSIEELRCIVKRRTRKTQVARRLHNEKHKSGRFL